MPDLRPLFAIAATSVALFASEAAALAAPGPRSDEAVRAEQRAGAYLEVGAFAEAAGVDEAFAREHPVMDGAPEALVEAVKLRLGLGEPERARADAELFQRRHTLDRPALSAQILLAFGLHHTDQGDLPAVRRLLEEAMPSLDRRAPLDRRILAHAMLGRTLLGLGEGERAGRAFSRVREEARDLALLRKSLASFPEDEAAQRYAQALYAVAEARFFAADQSRIAADRIQVPPYRGSDQREEILAYLQKPFSHYMERKRGAIEVADAEFRKLLDLEPLQPRWAMAAAARVGQLWAGFSHDLRSAPLPRPTAQELELLRDGYFQFIDPLDDVPLLQAEHAFKYCLETSVKYRIVDESSRACEAWLTKNRGAEYKPVNELYRAPSWLDAPLAAEPAPR